MSGSVSLTPPAETPEQSVREPPKEKVKDEQSSSLTEITTADQQPSDTTPPSTAQEAAAASASTSHSQPPDTTATTEEETMSSPADSSTAASNSVSKTKEIKIARLDVSNVALDTEKLELKETSATVRIFFYFSVFSSFGHSQNSVIWN